MEETRDFRREKDLATEDNAQSEKSSIWKRIAIFVGALVLAFLLGLIPMWMSEREAVKQRDAAQTNLRLSRTENRLAAAAIDARRGEYEQARLSASDFYTDLRAEVERSESAFNADQRRALQPILAQRDEVITLLARNDPAGADRLMDLYAAYKQAVNSAPQPPK